MTIVSSNSGRKEFGLRGSVKSVVDEWSTTEFDRECYSCRLSGPLACGHTH